ncbi:MAG: epoxyqueuosine reductase QueH [Bacteroidales bacterium]|nr:epoxyqueuosine reductase QueH [Bacteroidales bacterium]
MPEIKYIPPTVEAPGNSTEVLLHACCAPCSSAILECLIANKITPTVFYFNPNIFPREEYEIRKAESKRQVADLGLRFIDADYDHEAWLGEMTGLESEPERGSRCAKCFKIRLLATAQCAEREHIPCFATTLSSSRWKSLEQIDEAGQWAENQVSNVRYWAHNWRKQGLSERRNQLLREGGFYNQQYCGCEFSFRNR